MFKANLGVEIPKVYFWTDSKITLHYPNNETARFCTFVATPVTTIRETTRCDQWRHVTSNLSPADLVSRVTVNHEDVPQRLAGPPIPVSTPSTTSIDLSLLCELTGVE
ncbi:hypothetical protein FGIG_10594 [Fasciola gigantica]|uniref:Uncharacterized protein n=1 Tax=Fasciola gigantica TaxID=46835 RepID=A0A504YQU5_FASGI|nr:hypothetical protein FGIG_10594 [Fasciola gigantica]